MIAIDTNILVYAHRKDSAWHKAAKNAVSGLVEGAAPWLLPWPCVHEFYAVVTNIKIFKVPTPIETAVKQIEAWTKSPSCQLGTESPNYFNIFKDLVLSGKIQGSMVHDARIVGICLEHGASTLWSADRDFSRFPEIKAINPLLNEA